MEYRVNAIFEKLYLIYKVGRFSFSTGLLVLLLSIYSLNRHIIDKFSLTVLTVYSVVSLILFLTGKKALLFEFLLDELFLFLLVIKGAFSYGFFSLFLFFPILFSSLFLNRAQSLATLVTALTLQIVYFLIEIKLITLDKLIQFFLNELGLILISFFAQKIKEKLESQEEYLKELKKLQEETAFYKRLYEISANLAHELKNPLASIKGAVELLANGHQNQRLLNIVLNETERLDSIIKDFLSLARPISSEKSPVKVKEVVKEVCNRLNNSKECRVEGDDVSAVVEPKSFYSALDNLIRNALYWAKSTVRISVKENGEWIDITVEDDGPGIPEEEWDRVFEPFFSKRKEGSGLGLSVVRKFALEHGGFVFLRRSPLGGASFTLRIKREPNDESSNT